MKEKNSCNSQGPLETSNSFADVNIYKAIQLVVEIPFCTCSRSMYMRHSTGCFIFVRLISILLSDLSLTCMRSRNRINISYKEYYNQRVASGFGNRKQRQIYATNILHNLIGDSSNELIRIPVVMKYPATLAVNTCIRAHVRACGFEGCYENPAAAGLPR